MCPKWIQESRVSLGKFEVEFSVVRAIGIWCQRQVFIHKEANNMRLCQTSQTLIYVLLHIRSCTNFSE